MRPEERDAAHLWDMLEAARDAAGIIAGQKPAEFRRDRMRALALERSMEILGEAARRISDGFRAVHPELPWQEMIGLRNILAHEYGRIDHDKLFATAVNELPGLIVRLESLLPARKK
jgi:uncharacterized protein with HEPN domain